MNPDFWKNKRVLLTGHTGFKGAWLSLYLKDLGAKVTGYSLPPVSGPNLYEVAKVADNIKSIYGDIRHATEFEQALKVSKAEIVIHMAAQALVRASYRDPIETYSTNVMGLVNVFESIKKYKKAHVVINVTSDKCYENNEWLWGYRENDPMGGYDPYSSSKGCAELITSAYKSSFFESLNISIASARSGNVVGGGDWSEDRIIPDIIKSISTGESVTVRNPNATRPWQHALDPLTGYLTLAEKLSQPNGSQYAEAWNFGPETANAKSVQHVVEKTLALWPSKQKWQPTSIAEPHEATYLKLDCSKALTRLNWSPKWDFDNTIIETVKWYKYYAQGQQMADFTLEQISNYKKFSI